MDQRQTKLQMGRRFFLALVACASLIFSRPGMAEDNRDEVVRIFGGELPRADFVLVVDASLSMRPLIATLRQALPALVAELPEGDHLSVLRFSTTASPYIADRTIAADTRSALARELQQLAEPQSADRYTDLEAAINRTLEELARPNFNPVQVVVFITDFCHEPLNPGSARRFPGAPCFSWDAEALAQRAQRMLSGHSVRVLALALEGTREEAFALFHRVFPQALRVDVSVSRLGEYFERLRQELRYHKVAARAAEELKGLDPLVAWVQPRLNCRFGGSCEVNLEVKNPSKHFALKVRLQEVRALGGAGEELQWSRPKEEVFLPAGGTAKIPLTVQLPPRKHPYWPAKMLTLSEEAIVRLQYVAQPELGLRQLDVEPAFFREHRLALTLTAPLGQPWWLVAAVLLSLVGGSLFAVCQVGRRRPVQLWGTLRAWQGDREVGRWSLAQRRQSALTVGKSGADLVIDGAIGTVRLTAQRRGWCGRQVVFLLEPVAGQVSLGGRRLTGRVVLRGGELLALGNDVTARWSAQ